MMRIFSNKNIPQVRKWAVTTGDKMARKANDNDPKGLALVLSFGILKDIGTFFVPAEKNKKKAMNDPFGSVEKYDTDICLFEALCYELSLLDLWLINNEKEPFRQNIYNALVVPFCLEKFQAFLGSGDLRACLANRSALYEKIAKTEANMDRQIERHTWHLCQLVYRAAESNEAMVFDFDKFPVYLADIREEFGLRTCVAAYTSAFLPAHMDFIDFMIGRLQSMDYFKE